MLMVSNMANSPTKVAKSATYPVQTRTKVLPSLSEVDIKNMRIFKEVVERSGFSAAAHILGMEKSGVSRAVTQLEDRLGEVLCTRGPKGFELSDFGKAVYGSAMMLADAVEAARSEMMRARNALTGTIRLAVPDNCQSNPNAFLRDVLSQFGKQLPEAELHLHVMSSEAIREALAERRVHLAISSSRLPESRYVNEFMFDEEFRLYMQLEQGMKVPHLAQLRSRGVALIRREDDQLEHWHTDALAQLRDRKLFASGLEAVALLMQSGHYAGFLPTHYVESRAQQLAYCEVPGSEALRYRLPFYMCYERDRPRAFVASRMIDFFSRSAKKTEGSKQI